MYGQFIRGPNKQIFFLSKPSEDDKTEDKVLEYSKGSITDVDEVKVKYALDLRGGAAGSPLLGNDWRVKAIHTFWSNKENISGGIQIRAIVEDLHKLRGKYTSLFNEIAEPNKIEMAAERKEDELYPDSSLVIETFIKNIQDLFPGQDINLEIGKKERIRKEPVSILNISHSVCMILFEDGNTMGTGFLARIPGFGGVALFSAGHLMKPNTNYDGHMFYFKATDGDENAKGVLKVPFQKMLSRKFTFVTSSKGKRTVACKTTGREDIDIQNHSMKKGDDIHRDLNYCVIFLYNWDKFIKDNKLKVLDIDMEKATPEIGERVFYAGHPYLGIPLGVYVCNNANPDDDSRYAELKETEESGVYQNHTGSTIVLPGKKGGSVFRACISSAPI